MAQAQTYAGTPEQLAKRLNRLPATQKYKMTLTAEETTAVAANEEALAMLRDLARMKEGMQETDGTDTDRLLREGRAGAMYDHSSSD